VRTFADFLDASSGLEGAVLLFGLLALLLAWVGGIREVWLSELSPSIKWVVIIGGVLGFLGYWYPSIGEYITSAGTAAALWPLAAYPRQRRSAKHDPPRRCHATTSVTSQRWPGAVMVTPGGGGNFDRVYAVITRRRRRDAKGHIDAQRANGPYYLAEVTVVRVGRVDYLVVSAVNPSRDERSTL
jgi:hypothetical protein